jgi:flagellin-specific chaperone FliS
MEQKSTSKKVDKSQEIASCRKSISEIVIMLKEEVRLLTVLLDKLTISDKNLIEEEILEVLEKSKRMIHDISRSLKMSTDKNISKNLFPKILK